VNIGRLVDHPAKLVAFLTAVVALVASGVKLADDRINGHELSIQLWSVVDDHQGPSLDATTFKETSLRDGPSNALLDRAAGRILQAVSTRMILGVPNIRISVRVPTDLTAEEIIVVAEPEPPLFERHYYVVVAGAKSRATSDSSRQIAKTVPEFDVELSSPGFKPAVVHVTKNQPGDIEQVMAAEPVSIGLEKPEGEPAALDSKLSEALVRAFTGSQASVQIKPPGALAELRQQVEKEKAQLAAAPFMQIGIRTRLGVHFLITTSYRRG
jgi:hypothetical protein